MKRYWLVKTIGGDRLYRAEFLFQAAKHAEYEVARVMSVREAKPSEIKKFGLAKEL